VGAYEHRHVISVPLQPVTIVRLRIDMIVRYVILIRTIATGCKGKRNTFVDIHTHPPSVTAFYVECESTGKIVWAVCV